MTFQKSETMELKEIVVEDIMKEIVAFANSMGGTLYIGVADDGSITGVDNPDTTTQQISNMVRDGIKPNVTMFIHYDTTTIEEKQIVTVEVHRGTERPYYLTKKGLRPEGVYVRQGAFSVPASAAAIRKMIKDTDGDSFETMRSLEQDLNFEATTKEFASRNIKFEIPQMKTLGIFNADGIYTNLGLLLSDQCAHTVKVAVFEGTNQNIFRDRQEFSGSLLQQLEEIYEYIERRNQVRSTFEGLYRIDTRDYPEVAIREALLNSLVHRDYSFSASTLISMYNDRIEFTSIGGLPTGILLDDIMIGLSVCRNPKLANVFYRLELIEAYGTGIKKIMNSYTSSAEKPIIETTDNAFKIILPNQNKNTAAKPIVEATDNGLKVISPDQNKNTAAVTAGVDDKSEQQILDFIQKNGSITRKEVENITNMKQTSAGRLLNRMVQKHLILQTGKGKNTCYILPQ